MSRPSKGVDRCDAVTYQELLDQDSRPAPAVLRIDSPVDLGSAPISARRYTDQAFFQREVQKVFLRSWQYVCRVEEIPNPGDTQVFDIVGRSALVVRQLDGGIRAFRNICLHRGRKLVTVGGCKSQFRCPYHGFVWNTDGSFRDNPIAWDFPAIDEAGFGLPELRAETWGGFVFINHDANAEPLAKVADPLPDHFARWNIENCYKAAHVGKLVPANWKAVIEAFLESHHVYATHPQLSPYVGDANSQYDVLSDHVTRFLTPLGTPSPLLETALSDAELVKAMLGGGGRAGQSSAPPLLPAGHTARQFLGDMARQRMHAETGRDYTQAADAEMLDGISYQLFPNFAIWGGFPAKIGYRWRPHDLRVDMTLMEVFLFKEVPATGERPEPAFFHLLGEDEPWATATELEHLAPVFDQDQSNLGPLQEGLRDMGEEGVVHFGRYSEVRCRHIHRMVDRYLAR